MEELFEELVAEGVIVKCPKVLLSDYLGEYSYLATTLRQANVEPQPSLSDIRRVITEYAILPLGASLRLVARRCSRAAATASSCNVILVLQARRRCTRRRRWCAR